MYDRNANSTIFLGTKSVTQDSEKAVLFKNVKIDSDPSVVLAFAKTGRLQVDLWQAVATYSQIDFHVTSSIVSFLHVIFVFVNSVGLQKIPF